MRRALTEDERKLADEIFRGSIDLSRVCVTRNSVAAMFSATAIGNTINLRARDFQGAAMVLSDAGRVTLIHELGHVWQFQNHGIGYIPKSLWAQLVAFVKTGNRRAAYDWLTAANAGTPWEKWNPEQQAECIACYSASWRRQQTGKTATAGNPGGLTDDAIVTMTAPYLDLVWQRRGAPRK